MNDLPEWTDDYEYVFQDTNTGEYWYFNDPDVLEEVEEANQHRGAHFKRLKGEVQTFIRVPYKRKADLIRHLGDRRRQVTDWILSQTNSVRGFDLNLFTFSGLKKIYKDIGK